MDTLWSKDVRWKASERRHADDNVQKGMNLLVTSLRMIKAQRHVKAKFVLRFTHDQRQCKAGHTTSKEE